MTQKRMGPSKKQNEGRMRMAALSLSHTWLVVIRLQAVTIRLANQVRTTGPGEIFIGLA